MIIISDPLSSRKGHTLAFNTSVLEVVHAACPSENLIFLSLPSLIKEVKERVSFKDFETLGRLKDYDPEVQSSLGLRVRAFMNYWIAWRASQRYKAKLILTNAETISLGLFLKLLPQQSTKNIILISHKNIQDATKGWLKYRGLRSILVNVGKFLVFEEMFVKDLENLFPNQSMQNVHVVYLPLPADLAKLQINKNRRKITSGITNISFVGSLRSEKGLEILPEVVRILSKNSQLKNQLHLGIYGDMPAHFREQFPPDCSFLTLVDKYLDHSEYINTIKNSDFLIVPHKKEFYPRVSGVLLDAFSLRTPVIASDNLIFCYYFEQYGDMGIMFEADNPKSLADAIVRSIEVTTEEYESYKDNIDKFCKDRSLARIAEQFKSEVLEKSKIEI